MDYISREDWYELSKWLDISQGFYEAYTRFRIEGQEVHWLNFNERNIEVGFFYDDENSDWINVKLYCPDVEVEFNERFLLNENAYSNEKRITKEIIAKIYRLAWSSFYPEVFKVTTGDSEKAYKQIEKILIEKDCLCHDAYWEMEAYDVECIIKLYGRKILVHLQVNDCDESCTDFWLECLDTDRSLLQVVGYGNGTMEDIIQRIQYLALEPECFKIITTDYEWEYELIRAIVDNAIHVCPYARESGKEMEERTIELHGRQIKMQFRRKDKVQPMPKERDYYISVHLDCITTGRSISCAVEAFDENPQELIWKIQELAWEPAETEKEWVKDSYGDSCMYSLEDYCSILLYQLQTGPTDVVKGSAAIYGKLVNIKLTRNISDNRFQVKVTMEDETPIEYSAVLIEEDPNDNAENANDMANAMHNIVRRLYK